MPNPVVELIAQELLARVATVTVANGYNQTLAALRPSGLSRDVAPANNVAVIVQGDPQPAEGGYPGNPPTVAFRQAFAVIVYIRPSEADTTAIDTLVNRAAADVVRAVRNDADWHTFGGHAIEADVLPAMYFSHDDEQHDGVAVTFDVVYRHPENDPYYLWTPLDLPGDEVFYFSADSGDLLDAVGGSAVVDGGDVGYWPAIGGSGEFAQTHSNAAASKPTWLAEGIGGQPALLFDANGESLEMNATNATRLQSIFNNAGNNDPLMLAAVFRYDDPGDTNFRTLLGVVSTSGAGCGIASRGGSSDQLLTPATGNAGGPNLFASSVLVDGAAQLSITQLADADSHLWLNGTEIAADTSKVVVNSSVNVLAAIGAPWNFTAANCARARLAAWVLTRGAIWSAADRAQLTRFFNAKYGL